MLRKIKNRYIILSESGIEVEWESEASVRVGNFWSMRMSSFTHFLSPCLSLDSACTTYASKENQASVVLLRVFSAIGP